MGTHCHKLSQFVVT